MALKCPQCGRFLRRDVVEELAARPVDCPECGARIPRDEAPRDEVVSRLGDAVPAGVVGSSEVSPGRNRGVLDGWDVGVAEAEVASWNRDARPFPVDVTAIVAGAAAGAVSGARSAGAGRARAAATGAVVGAAIAAGARRIWRLAP